MYLDCIQFAFPNSFKKGILLNIFYKNKYINHYNYNIVSNKLLLNDWKLKSLLISKKTKEKDIIRQIKLYSENNFIHILWISSYKIYNLLKPIWSSHIFKAGIIILEKPPLIKTKYLQHFFYFRKILEKQQYALFNSDDKSIIYYNNFGYPPYFLGQTISSKYIIIHNFKSGCGSLGVFLVRDINNSENIAVLKICHTEKSYYREKSALVLTKDWPHSPNLIDYNDSQYFLIQEYCGKDLKKIETKQKKNLKPYVNKVLQLLKGKYGLYHNDIRWKNLVLGKYHIEGKSKTLLRLIDWGNANNQNIDKNHDNIIDKNLYLLNG